MIDDAAPQSDDATAASEQPDDNDALFRKLRGWFRVDREASSAWREEAREDYDFAAGHQWSKEDEATLKEQGRPPITFNRILPVIKAVCGSEVNNRQDIQFKPRQIGAAGLNEVLTEASRYLAQEADAEDEESDAFCDLAICGMGWVEQRIDYEFDPDGAYVEDRVNPLEMIWDSTARKRNLIDGRRMFRAKRMDQDAAKALFPDADVDELDACWAEDRDGEEPHRNPLPNERRKEDDSSIEGTREVCIVEAQWFDRVPIMRVVEPSTGEITEYSEADFRVLEQRAAAIGMPLQSGRAMKRVFRKAFLGGSGLLEPATSSPTGDAFSCKAMTGDRDQNKGTWFGIVRPMRDPQRFGNKWLSQTLDMLNRQSKGGVFMEKSAAPDQREFERTFAKAGATTWVADGTITGGRMKDKPLPQLPAGHMQLMEFALTSIRDTSGVNLEMLGQQQNDQAGVLEAQRKKAALTILATLFDSLRRARKHIGRGRLYMIQNFLSDGRLVRIVDQGVDQYIPLVRDKVAGEYDVIVDDAPTSVDQKEIIWATFTSIFPVIKDMITPQVIAEILPYSPFPASFVAKMQQLIGQNMGPSPEQQEQQQLGIAQVKAKIGEHLASAQLKSAQAGREVALTHSHPLETAIGALTALAPHAAGPQSAPPPDAPFPGGSPGQPLPQPIQAPPPVSPALTGFLAQRAMGGAPAMIPPPQPGAPPMPGLLAA